jgi:2,3-bisphosphoglycerate-independent phosphoglycerate mutase
MVLAILDGFGHRDECDHNALCNARMPNWRRLWQENPHGLIDGSGRAVGLPHGQMGNSEVGHLNIGAGRVIHQDLTRISLAIEDGSFAKNPALLLAIEAAKGAGATVHVAGLLSPGGVHSHEDHLIAMAQLAARRGARVAVHAILDGRDTPPKSARDSLDRMQKALDALDGKDGGDARISTICGRYFAMDRDKRWDRVQKAYDLYTRGVAEATAPDALWGLEQAYQRGETDEFVKPTLIVSPGATPRLVADYDAWIFMNFRADRAREITEAFIVESFDGFPRAARPQLSSYVCLTQYRDDFDAAVAFPTVRPRHTLGEHLADLGLTQLRIAETEKYAHVTFFFNGGEERVFAGEDRILVPSPKVATYDQQPEMSAPEVTDLLVKAIGSGKYDFIVVNYANADMVGHTGYMDAAVKAAETLDACLGRLVAAVRDAGGELLVTADHGNIEQMFDEATDQPHTAHTTNLVPLLYVGRKAKVASGGVLSDVAPTLLRLMGLPKPAEMTGRELIQPEG